jgi:hypothetical protein
VWLCLKIPAVIAAAPQIEGVWIGFGEVGMLATGGLVLFARLSQVERPGPFKRLTGQQGIRSAQIVFGLSLIPAGLGHIFYAEITKGLVPSWMPFRLGLAYTTGVGQIARGAAILFSILPRRAAYVEAAMLARWWLLLLGDPIHGLPQCQKWSERRQAPDFR